MNITKEQYRELIDKLAVKTTIEIEGCQAFSEDCGKKPFGKFECEYCRKWNGQQREEIRLSQILIGDVLEKIRKMHIEDDRRRVPRMVHVLCLWQSLGFSKSLQTIVEDRWEEINVIGGERTQLIDGAENELIAYLYKLFIK